MERVWWVTIEREEWVTMDREEWVTLVYGSYVPILGASVTLLNADSYCCFLWCFYTSVWLDHLISSFYLVWVIRLNFGGSGHTFKCWWLQLFLIMFLYISMVGSSNIIILSVWVIRPNFGGSGHAFKCWWLLLFLMMFLYISMVGSSNIIILSGMGHTSQFWGLWSHF